MCSFPFLSILDTVLVTVELQWLEHQWSHENMLETGVAGANECVS